MSIRVKFAALYTLLFALMTLMMGYSVENSGIQRSEAPSFGVLLLAIVAVSLLVIFLVLLSWRDLSPGKKKYPVNVRSYLMAWAFAIAGAAGILYYIGRSNPTPPVNSTLNSSLNSTTANGSAIPPAPVYHNDTVSAAPPSGVPSSYLLYGAALLFLAGLSYFAVIYYREALRRRKLREMRLKAELFDRKVEELGLEMFSDPREAVVGIYKNAVLWLEILGVPYKESWTHWEHAERVQIFREPFRGITELFEKAKYAPEKVTWEDAERALELYRKMRGAVNEVS
ncbi:hypothetical protein CL1_1018 [Thermococcus cleftensis]|uniref:Protein-glutamine gamma-glutamyltransferase-like C-terminal domain-containing protein n=1 Tax=Thermococcus cleftensis (strain DSM 27260 / KACC 17922 / CL1) TaxID=163003 RepID=I3ZU37_THECF|nr:DUF4129 domain-containing protein [Thermococcus cleftensis]AFL95221.1 hypothetical protein CL1_1018 [Thermococcus cleftensis]